MENDLEIFRPQGPLYASLIGPDDPVYRVLVAAFILASMSHLWLLDAAQDEWMFSNALYVIGILILIFGRGLAGWLLCALALSIPLLFHRDQLTQSVILMLFAAAGAAGCALDLTGKNGLPTTQASIRIVTILTYVFATLHKLNRDFFEPATSCANYGLAEVLDYYHVGVVLPEWFQTALPGLIVLTEGAIVVLYLLRRRRIVWILATAFHIALTLTMAPAFVFVVAAGHAAFVEDADLRQLGKAQRDHGRVIGAASALLLCTSLGVHGAWPEWTMIPREWLLWFLLLWFVAAFSHPGELLLKDRWAWDQVVPAGRAFTMIVGVGFALNCLTPYLGLQYQHTAAMLSNLRIDRGCWNSYVFPESTRITEDYIRIDSAYFGSPGALEEYENILREQLWNPAQVRQMQRNWCKNTPSPFFVSGTYRERTFEIADLCSATTLPFADDGVLGIEVFPQYLRFQKNLMRTCPQTCIH